MNLFRFICRQRGYARLVRSEARLELRLRNRTGAECRRPTHVLARGRTGAAHPRSMQWFTFRAMLPITINGLRPETAAGPMPKYCPIFKRAESFEGQGDDDYHGYDGPLSVKSPIAPMIFCWIGSFRPGKQAGFALTDDFNGRQQEGFSRYEHTMRALVAAGAAQTVTSSAKPAEPDDPVQRQRG